MGQITHGYSLLTLMGTVPSRHFITVSNPERDNVLINRAHWYRSQGIAFFDSAGLRNRLEVFWNFGVMNKLRHPLEGTPLTPSEAFMEPFVTLCARNLKLGYSTINLYFKRSPSSL